MIGVKSADIVVGKHITEVIFAPLNNHLFNCFKEMVESKSPKTLKSTEWRRLAAGNNQIYS